MCLLLIRCWPNCHHTRCTTTEKCRTSLSTPGLSEYDCPAAKPIFIDEPPDWPCPLCASARSEELHETSQGNETTDGSTIVCSEDLSQGGGVSLPENDEATRAWPTFLIGEQGTGHAGTLSEARTTTTGRDQQHDHFDFLFDQIRADLGARSLASSITAAENVTSAASFPRSTAPSPPTTGHAMIASDMSSETLVDTAAEAEVWLRGSDPTLEYRTGGAEEEPDWESAERRVQWYRFGIGTSSRGEGR